MKPLGCHNYFVYITTNKNKTVLYVGVTNHLSKRLFEHTDPTSQKINTFTKKYNAFCLVYYERFDNIVLAITREKQIKGWNRRKKEALISGFNPSWRFLNDDVD